MPVPCIITSSLVPMHIFRGPGGMYFDIIVLSLLAACTAFVYTYNLFRDRAVRRYSNLGVFTVILCQSNDNRTPYFNKTAEVCRNSWNELHNFDSLKDTWFIIQAFEQFSELSNVRRKYLCTYSDCALSLKRCENFILRSRDTVLFDKIFDREDTEGYREM